MTEASTSLETCPLCKIGDLQSTAKTVNGVKVCATCAQDIIAEAASQNISAYKLALSIGAALLGAAAGALVWVALSISSNTEIGYLAILIGYLAARGLLLVAGKSRGLSLQIAAATCAAIGLFLAKLAVVDYHVTQYALKDGADVGYFSGIVLSTSALSLVKYLDFYDFLWLFLALSIAWKMPRRQIISIED